MNQPTDPIGVALQAKLAFIRKMFGHEESYAQFAAGAKIDHGRHPEAEHRVDVYLALLTGMYFVFVEKALDSEAAVNAWVNQPYLLLGGMDPLEYLIGSDEFSDSLWLGVALNSFFPDEYHWMTDQRAAKMLALARPLIDGLVSKYQEEK